MQRALQLTDSELRDVIPTLIALEPVAAPRNVLRERYELQKEIGRGGFGKVLLAKQLGLGREVAVKMLLNQYRNSAFSKRFIRECNVMKKLIHPNTIQIYDVGEDEAGNLFYVMEYLEGETLEAVLARQQCCTVKRTVHIAKQILKSLFEAHQQGILHRDLKPGNIFLRKIPGEKDFVKVLDFGIAKSLQTEDAFFNQLTKQGMILGTPRYIAPEYYTRGRIGPHSDIYSLGLMMIRMVTGHNPISNDPLQAMKAHVSSEPVPLPRCLAKTRFGQILHKATSKNVDERYNNCMQFLQDLEEIPLHELNMEHKEASSPAEPMLPLRLNPANSRKVLLLAIFVCLCIACILSGIMVYQRLYAATMEGQNRGTAGILHSTTID